MIANDNNRYEISTGKADWEDAERLISKTVKNGDSNIVVAVKSSKDKKRKAGEAVAEALKEANGGSAEGSKKPKKSKHGKSLR